MKRSRISEAPSLFSSVYFAQPLISLIFWARGGGKKKRRGEGGSRGGGRGLVEGSKRDLVSLRRPPLWDNSDSLSPDAVAQSRWICHFLCRRSTGVQTWAPGWLCVWPSPWLRWFLVWPVKKTPKTVSDLSVQSRIGWKICFLAIKLIFIADIYAYSGVNSKNFPSSHKATFSSLQKDKNHSNRGLLYPH